MLSSTRSNRSGEGVVGDEASAWLDAIMLSLSKYTARAARIAAETAATERFPYGLGSVDARLHELAQEAEGRDRAAIARLRMLARQIERAVTLIQLGARLQVLESETDLSYERLLRLYKEVAGKSPSKGQLPFSTDWFMTWQPNIHASLFLNIHEYLNKVAEMDEIDDGAERAADQPLDFLRPPRLLARRRLTPRKELHHHQVAQIGKEPHAILRGRPPPSGMPDDGNVRQPCTPQIHKRATRRLKHRISRRFNPRQILWPDGQILNLVECVRSRGIIQGKTNRPSALSGRGSHSKDGVVTLAKERRSQACCYEQPEMWRQSVRYSSQAADTRHPMRCKSSCDAQMETSSTRQNSQKNTSTTPALIAA